MGKRTKANIRANQILVRKMLEHFAPDPPRCEARIAPTCSGFLNLDFHHWPKRSTGFYVNQPDKLHDLNHVIMACWVCHPLLDGLERHRNEEIFKRERG